MTTAVPVQIAFIDLGAQRDRIRERLDAAVSRVLEHGRFILGPEVAELERRLEEHCGSPYAVTCANGTDALELALAALGMRPGDEVVVPSFTFGATAEAVARLGGVPRFADIDRATFNLDPACVRDAFESAGGVPVGLIAVDLFGQPADYPVLGAVAAEHGAWLIADAAQSFGAASDGTRVGTMAPITTTSFFPAKPLGCCGDGGALLVESEEMAERLRSLRVHGQGTDKYDNVRIGQNSRLDTLQAAILLEKLAIFDTEIEARQLVADRYADRLGDVAQVPRMASGSTSVWAQYTILLEASRRDSVRAALQAQGIPTGVYYRTPLHRQSAYRQFPAASGGLPVSEELAERVLSLPMHPYLEAAVQERIIGALHEALS